MSEHTPGPWTVGKYDKHIPINATNGLTVAYMSSVTATGKHVFADARLIAAAPEMYDALVAIQNRIPLKDSPLGGHTCGVCRMCFEIAEQAITKAEGRAP